MRQDKKGGEGLIAVSLIQRLKGDRQLVNGSEQTSKGFPSLIFGYNTGEENGA